jgi:flagellar hook-associated protein 2
MTLSVGGIISGLETESIISQLLNIERQPIFKLQQQEADYQVELTAYSAFKSVLNSLKSTVAGLDSTSDFQSFSASSGDTDIFTVSANSSATTGSYDITVEQMAEAHKLKSANFATDTEEVVKFTIDNSNNKIDFFEDGTNDNTLVATLTNGDYTVSELEAEIETQLEAASAGAGSPNSIDYTVSYDSATKKFTIEEDGSELTELKLLWNSGANKTNSAGALLGFNKAADDTGATSYIGDTKMGEVFTVSAASNDKIKFKEDVGGGLGAELTATLTSGNYTVSDMEAEIKSQLETASDGGPNNIDYTVTYNSATQKFTIKENGSSLTELQLLWGTGANVANSAASLLGFDAANDTGAVTYTSDNEVYKSTLHIEIGSTFTIDSTNNKINFKERDGGGLSAELTATITSGTHTISELETEIKTQLEAQTAKSVTYTVSYDNSKEKFIISGTGAGVTEIQFLWNTGTDEDNGAASTLGFSTTADDTGLLAYTADDEVGDVAHVSISASDDIDDVADAILITITAANSKIDFNEGGGDLVATITEGTYTSSELASAVKTALEDAGSEYTVSYDSSTKRFAIDRVGSGELNLLWQSGANKANGAASALGFSTAADDTGSASGYTGNYTVGGATDVDVGVNAAVIFDGTNYVLTLTGEDTGADNSISITATDPDGDNTDANGLSRLAETNLTEIQAAKDSIIEIDSISVTRATNTISDAINGVTITLVSEHETPATDSDTLTVTRNTSAISSKIESFVSAYNNVVDFFDTYQGYDAETKVAGILLGDPTTNLIRNNLRNNVADAVPGVDSFDRLSDLGITLDDEGKLEVDSSTLSSAMSDYFDDVVQFFTQSIEASEGFAVRMVDDLESFLDSDDGILPAREEGIQSSIDDIQAKVERLEARLEVSEDRLRAQFVALEVLLGQYQVTGDFLSQQLLGFQNLNRALS